jgi:hypothetical protein
MASEATTEHDADRVLLAIRQRAIELAIRCNGTTIHLTTGTHVTPPDESIGLLDLTRLSATLFTSN